MSNSRFINAVKKLARNVMVNKPPTEAESEVAKVIQKLTHSLSVSKNTVTYGMDHQDERYFVKVIVKELWNGEFFAFYSFANSYRLREWSDTFETKTYKGNPKKVGDLILSEIEKTAPNILSNLSL
jgi:hypothetical protein